jgi:hypothetical protein
MGYSMIVLVASVALVAWFIFAADASIVSKLVVAALFLWSFVCFFWIRMWALVGLFSMVAVSIFVTLYRAYQQAKIPEK